MSINNKLPLEPQRQALSAGLPEAIRGTFTAGCGDIDPCTPCIYEWLSTPYDEGYARNMLPWLNHTENRC